ncbi:MAG: WYL domain-containing protein, partial [Desulfobacterales bacterium]|nr:WYL domain-containing protein [Desulfobacterales bacterium]
RSESEVITLALSFGDEIKILAPDKLVKEVKETVEKMQKRYS